MSVLARVEEPATSGELSRGPDEAQTGRPVALWWLAALVLAVITAVVWPTIPSYDPFSWVVWGHEVTDPHISFYVGGGPSWKPLPFVFTTIYGAFGGIAPALWVTTARIGGIAGLFGAWRLAARLCARAGLPRWAGWAAGVVAAVAIVLTTDWSYYFFRGASEPVLIACALWAVDRAIDRRHWQAFLLLAAEGLMRPEAWPFLLAYGAWLCWRGDVRTRVLVVLGLIAQPVGWFVPPWISTGQPFLAATHASQYNGHLGSNPFVTVIGRGESLQPLPALVLAAVAVLIAVWAARDRLRRVPPPEVWLAAGIVAWWVVVVAMTLDGYPGLQRFFLPAAALTCVLGGVGLVRVAALCGRGAGRLVAGLGAGRVAAWVGVAVGLLLLAGSYHYVSARIRFVRHQEPLAAVAVRRIDDLGTAIDRLGGRRALLPCRSSVVTINHSLQTALAWKLGTTLERVQTVLRVPGVAFVGPHDSIDGGVPPIAFHFAVRDLARVGDWRIQQVFPAGTRPGRCVGR